MSTLSLRAVHLPHIRLMPSIARALAVFSMVIDVFAEAQDMARAAQKRYPFAEG